MKCVNESHPVYVEAVAKHGEKVVKKAWERNKYELPDTVAELDALIKENNNEEKIQANKIKKDLKDVLLIQKAAYKKRKGTNAYIEEIDEVLEALNTEGITGLLEMINVANHFTEQAMIRITNIKQRMKVSIDNITADDLERTANEMNEIKNFLSAYTVLEKIESLSDITIDQSFNLRSAISTRRDIVGQYKNLHDEILAQWLYGQAQRVNENLTKNGVDPSKLITIERIKDLINNATTDIRFLEKWFGAAATSTDPLTGLVAATLKKEAFKRAQVNQDNLYKLMPLYEKASGNKNNVSEFNKKYLQKIKQRQWIPTLDKQGNPVIDDKGRKQGEWKYIDRTAFIGEYREDLYEQARQEKFNELMSSKILSDDNKWKGYYKWLNENTEFVEDPLKIIEEKQRILSPLEFDRWLIENTKRKKIITYEDGSTTLSYIDPARIKTTSNGYVTVYGKGFFRPVDKYKNPQYDSVKNDPYYQELYNLYKRSNDLLPPDEQLEFGIIPQIRMHGYEKYIINSNDANLAKNLGDDIRHSVNVEAYDNTYGLQRPDGTELKRVPVYFTGNVEERELSHDLLQSTILFSKMANNFYYMNRAEPFVTMLTDSIQGNRVVDISPRNVEMLNAQGKIKTNPITGNALTSSTNKVNEALIETIDKIVYGEVEIPHLFKMGDKEYSMNKISKKVIQYASLNGLALNINSFFNNTLLGNYQMAIEAAAGKYFNSKELIAAEGLYWKELKSMLDDAIKGYPTSKVGKLAFKYDAIQGEFENELGHNLSGDKVKRAFASNPLMILTKGAEHQIHITGMIAMMQHQKVKNDKGETMSLYDAYDEKGRLKKGVQWSEDDVFNFQQKLHKLNKEMHGVYNTFDSPTLSRRWAGKLALLFRKYMYSGFRKRWGQKYLDIEEGDENQGYYNEFFSYILNTFKANKADILTGKNMTLSEKRAKVRTLTDLFMIIALMALYTALKGGDDDGEENSWMENQLTLQTRRLAGDIMFFLPVNPMEPIIILRTPTVALTYIEHVIKFVGQLVTNPLEEYQKDSGIYDKGDYKIKKHFNETFPVLSKIDNTLTPEQSLKIYNISGW